MGSQPLVPALSLRIRKGSSYEIMSDEIITSVSKLKLDDNGIIQMEFPQKNVKINIEDSKGIFQGRMQLTNAGKEQLLMVDLRNNPKPDREARDYARSQEFVETTRAMAILVGGPMSKMLGNFFLGFNKGDFPVKLFTEKENAADWLMQYK